MERAWALPEIDEALCDGCGDCVTACRAGAVAIVAERAAVTRPEACDYCTDCEAACPVEAIHCPFEFVRA